MPATTKKAPAKRKAPATLNRHLIFDLGMNHGEDSLFYLQKGFKVVAVEASPVIYAKMLEEFHIWIETGQLTVLNVGVWDAATKLKFYRNLDNDHWSSFDPAYGTRDGTKFEEIDIDCVTLDTILKEYGVPYYLKIDIEGADKIAVSSLTTSEVRPAFVSVEEYGPKCIKDLHAVGYDRFKIVPQGNKSAMNPSPAPALEGSYVNKYFNGRDTGLFGLELPGEWLTFDEAYAAFTSSVRDEAWNFVGTQGEWYDVHATRSEFVPIK